MFYTYVRDGVTVYASSLMDHVPHGFSTRTGGVSEGDALGASNMGFGKEPDATVRENRRRFAAAAVLPSLGSDVFVSAAEQIHSDVIFRVTKQDADAAFRGDGFYTNESGVTVAVKTADCVPVLLATKDGHCVAAVHAGWRGTASGIASLAVSELCGFGYDPTDIVAATGPAVQVDEYKVGDNFEELLFGLMSSSRSAPVRENAKMLSKARLVIYADGIHCNLPALNRDILVASGVPSENIDVCPVSTYENPQLFYSHRRQGADRGVMASAIATRDSTVR